MPRPRLIAITLARKPLIGPVHANVLAHGAGGINIDECRIAHGCEVDTNAIHRQQDGTDRGFRLAKSQVGLEIPMYKPGGRWPANLLFQHLQGCQRVGEVAVPGGRRDTRPEGDGGREDRSQWRCRPTAATKRGYADENGVETTTQWDCAQGCPVADRNALSGDCPGFSGGGTQGAGFRRQYVAGETQDRALPAMYFGDTGGAARFFKQVQVQGKGRRLIRPTGKAEGGGAVYQGRQQAKGGLVSHSESAGLTTLGRWPANVVIQHARGCMQTGTATVPGYAINRWADGAKPFGGGAGHPYLEAKEATPETIATWDCAEGCPVADLDQQSGLLTSGKVQPGYLRNGTTQPSRGGFEGVLGKRDYPLTGFGDSGGASRFFKQVQSQAQGQEGMLTAITLARKPLEGTVAQNALEHGTGGINIDECRIGLQGEDSPSVLRREAAAKSGKAGSYTSGLSDSVAHPMGKIGANSDPSVALGFYLDGTYRAEHLGRWPANLLFQHLQGCQRIGTKRVKASPPTPAGWDRMNAALAQQGYRPNEYQKGAPPAPSDRRNAEGTEAVENWQCLSGCPVADLDTQSGLLTSGTGAVKRASSAMQLGNQSAAYGQESRPEGQPMVSYGDSGGASRFFKQVQVQDPANGNKQGCSAGCPVADLDQQSGELHSQDPRTRDSTPGKLRGYSGVTYMPIKLGWLHCSDTGAAGRFFKQVHLNPVPHQDQDQELHDYLLKLISPPPKWPAAEVLTEWPEDLSTGAPHTGFIIHGWTPTAKQAQRLFETLAPGGHICLFAPDTQPTGHTGAICLEEAGFEIRDTIIWVRGPGRLHYVAKACRKEREAGCQKLPAKKGCEAVDREEGTAGMDSPRAGAGRTAAKIRNFHPCLHPEAVVMTDRGHRAIQTIKVGDKVLAADGLFHSVAAPTRHPYTSECLYRIGVRGTNLTTLASDNHPFLIWRPTRKGNNILGGQVVWASADQVVKGDYTMTPVLPMGPGALAWPEDTNFWFVFGLWLAEGVSQVAGHGNNCYPSFSLHRKETDLVDRIKALIPNRNVSVYEHGENGIQVMAFDPQLGAQFKALGGSGAATKTVHPDVWLLAEPQRRALVEGYLAGDGGVVRTYLQAKSVSTDLATQMLFLAESLGYKTNLFWFRAVPGCIRGKTFKHTHPHYQMQFYSKDRAQTTRKAACPGLVIHEGVAYSLRYVQKVEKVPYQGDVVNLSVEGCPTFQTAVGMSHNTVKPIGVMARILADVPQDQGTVLDPFVGSGSTLLACLRTGHSGIGLERDAEYLPIAEARVRYWDRQGPRWDGAEIVVEGGQAVVPVEQPVEELDLMDMFD